MCSCLTVAFIPGPVKVLKSSFPAVNLSLSLLLMTLESQTENLQIIHFLNQSPQPLGSVFLRQEGGRKYEV